MGHNHVVSFLASHAARGRLTQYQHHCLGSLLSDRWWSNNHSDVVFILHVDFQQCPVLVQVTRIAAG